MKPLVVVVAVLFLLVGIHTHYGCDHDEEIARVKLLERRRGRKFARHIRDIGSRIRKTQATWESIRIQAYTDYILNDVENRTCYEEGQVYLTVAY
jgi:hypothetical protein